MFFGGGREHGCFFSGIVEFRPREGPLAREKGGGIPPGPRSLCPARPSRQKPSSPGARPTSGLLFTQRIASQLSSQPATPAASKSHRNFIVGKVQRNRGDVYKVKGRVKGRRERETTKSKTDLHHSRNEARRFLPQRLESFCNIVDFFHWTVGDGVCSVGWA